MDKYLKKGVSDTAEVSVAHTTFDLTAWAENLSSSQRAPPSTVKTKETPSNLNPPSVSSLRSSSPGLKSDSKRSSSSVSSARKSVGSERESSFSPGANKVDRVEQQEELRTSNSNRTSLETHRGDRSPAALLTTPPDAKKGQSGLSSSKVTSSPGQSLRSGGRRQQQGRENSSPEKKALVRTAGAPPLPPSSGEKHFSTSKPALSQAAGRQNPENPLLVEAKLSFFIRMLKNHLMDVFVFFPPEVQLGFSEPTVETTQCNFRPSTSPLTHSSPSQTTLPSADGYCIITLRVYLSSYLYVLRLRITCRAPKKNLGVRESFEARILVNVGSFVSVLFSSMASPVSSRHAGVDLSPQSAGSSPSLSRLTYISMNDGAGAPVPEHQKVPQDQHTCTLGSVRNS